ncbi:MAG: hypothetical protein R2838_24765 [Caldilineaceae bacterium]
MECIGTPSAARAGRRRSHQRGRCSPSSGGDGLPGRRLGAVELAIDDRGGEMLGHPIDLTVEDSCSAEGAVTAAQKISPTRPSSVWSAPTAQRGCGCPAHHQLGRPGAHLPVQHRTVLDRRRCRKRRHLAAGQLPHCPQ